MSDDEDEGPRSTFETYLAEGEKLSSKGYHAKALESISLALELKPGNRVALVARSKVYLDMGDNKNALDDAESALKEDKEFVRGLYAKAEALYAMGDFEYALMYYHRGNKLRSELEEFRLGIQKATEAIDNCIGERAAIKLENKGDLSFFAAQEDIGKKGKAGLKKKANLRQQAHQANKASTQKPRNEKTVKQLLGELSADRDYLEKLMGDSDFVHNRGNPAIYSLVQSGLSYLDSRVEFWQQQQPMYARKRERELRKWKPAAQRNQKPKKKSEASGDSSHFILSALEEIEDALDAGNAEESLQKAKSCLKTVESLDETALKNKAEIVGHLHSSIGTALIELGRLNEALGHFEFDLQIARKGDNDEGKSRALDNLGRVYAKMGNYEKAVEYWTEKLPLSQAKLESTWLFHEIGRCHLELKQYDDAHDYGEKALATAKEIDDNVWQLNASVLIAQSEMKMDDLPAAIESFERSLKLAEAVKDHASREAIGKALEDLNSRLVQTVERDDEEEEGDEGGYEGETESQISGRKSKEG
ncbi:outer dynein arm-docking complex subunit 4-like [Oscarella lobularis]|uniref:outer dynein arm-docking complex subunit 4-like n=1 Tax=Oscarella lobularis TaxID=121494 RepID=UPI003313FFD1